MSSDKENPIKGVTPLSPLFYLQKDLDNRLYTIPEITQLAQTSRRQVEYWTKIGLLQSIYKEVDPAIGSPATFYLVQEVIKAIIANELRRSGFSLKQVQQVIRNLEQTGIEIDKAEMYLLTDGYSVYYAFSNSEVVDVMKNNRQMLLLIPVHEHLVRLKLAA